MSYWCPSCEANTAERDPLGRAETYCTRAGCGYAGPARKHPEQESAGEIKRLRAELARVQAEVARLKDAGRDVGSSRCRCADCDMSIGMEATCTDSEGRVFHAACYYKQRLAAAESENARLRALDNERVLELNRPTKRAMKAEQDHASAVDEIRVLHSRLKESEKAREFLRERVAEVETTYNAYVKTMATAVRELANVPCDGKCGGAAIRRAKGPSYCDDCYEGARIVNQNAIANLRAERDAARRERDALTEQVAALTPVVRRVAVDPQCDMDGDVRWWVCRRCTMCGPHYPSNIVHREDCEYVHARAALKEQS